ncbi:MAG TPA: hypothetical protein VGK73_06410 [Polyangiaceae bacterium]
MARASNTPRLLRLLRAAALGSLLGPAGCGGAETGNQLEIMVRDDGVEYRADWTYRSFDVDVDLTLSTVERGDGCRSTAKLVINDVVSATDTYELGSTDCSELRLTDTGDIVLESRSTEHDWSSEALNVDTERELILLGPVATIDPETGQTTNFRFTLGAPPCSDNPDCDCGALRRYGGSAELSLDLGRRCE